MNLVSLGANVASIVSDIRMLVIQTLDWVFTMIFSVVPDCLARLSLLCAS